MVRSKTALLVVTDHEVTVDEWDDLFDINVRPAFILTKAVYPFMEKQVGLAEEILSNIRNGEELSLPLR